MNILVLLKQVPNVSEISIDPQTLAIDRSRAGQVLNPEDLHALEAGLTLAAEKQGSVTVLSMGPEGCEAVLREGLGMGANNAVRITDASSTYEPVPAPTVKRELTPEEMKRAKKALKAARASYFSGNKTAKPAKTPKSTDKIIIKSDSKGNVEAVRHTKEQNDKAQKILKEIRESYYKDKGKR